LYLAWVGMHVIFGIREIFEAQTRGLSFCYGIIVMITPVYQTIGYKKSSLLKQVQIESTEYGLNP